MSRRCWKSCTITTFPDRRPDEILDQHLTSTPPLQASRFLEKWKIDDSANNNEVIRIPIEDFYALPRDLRNSVLTRVLGDRIVGWSLWMLAEKSGLSVQWRSNYVFPRYHEVHDAKDDPILNDIIEYAREEKDQSSKSTVSKKRKRVSLTMRRKVWANTFGESVGSAPCICCRLTTISQLNFHVGHIQSHAEGGDLTLDNLLPICQSCNSSMGSENMMEFKKRQGFG